MVDFLRKRLQVFVSSTFSDLKLERQAAVEAILTAGHIPAGMELFASGDESQMEVIKQWIDESDVYLLILGGRYGSVEPTSKKSYTQLEYEYAIEESKPLFACAINDDALELKIKDLGSSAIETDNPSELKAFRELVLSKTVRFWDDTKDIKLAIGEALSNFARREDLVGWVRPHQEANMPALADEIARLSKENAKLRADLSEQIPALNIHGLSFEELTTILKAENLMEFLEEKKNALAIAYRPTLMQDTAELRKLCLYGLVHRGVDAFILTDEGRAYLNKLAITQIKDSKEEEDKA